MSDVKVEVAGGNMKVVLETKCGSGSNRVELHARAAYPGCVTEEHKPCLALPEGWRCS